MKTSFEYIDNVIDREVAAQQASTVLSEAQKGVAKVAAQKVISGFRVFDQKAENDALDRLLETKRNRLQTFINARDEVRQNLALLGVTPLAVCPTKAWEKICYDTKLYILQTNEVGQVGFSEKLFHEYYAAHKDKTGQKLDQLAQQNWAGTLERLFPTRVSSKPRDYRDSWGSSGEYKATLLLPDPPAEVAETLLKLGAIEGLKVAAVGEAIRFVEKLSEVFTSNSRAHKQDVWAKAQGYADYADWVKRDPIIYVEYGAAVAIVAQFGNFPIEQQVVDAAIATNELFDREIASPVTVAAQTSVESVYENQFGAQQALLQAQQAYHNLRGSSVSVGSGGAGGNGGAYTNTGGAYTNTFTSVNSAAWTGRASGSPTFGEAVRSIFG